jgi:hypothetical protein
MHVVGRYREAVGLVLRALQVGQVDRHLVADIDFDGFRRDVRTDQGGEDFDLVALLDVFSSPARTAPGCGLSVRLSVPTL